MLQCFNIHWRSTSWTSRIFPFLVLNIYFYEITPVLIPKCLEYNSNHRLLCRTSVISSLKWKNKPFFSYLWVISLFFLINVVNSIVKNASMTYFRRRGPRNDKNSVNCIFCRSNGSCCPNQFHILKEPSSVNKHLAIVHWLRILYNQ